MSIFSEENSYTPPSSVFNQDVYNSEAQRIALLGKFITAEFDIHGVAKNKQDNVLSVNIGNISGIYGITRFKNRDIVINDKKALFTQDNPLNLTIDLMAQTRLSGTLKEVDSGIFYKDLYLWDKIQPPPEDGTIVKFLFVPLAQDGTIGDTTITKLDFKYRCVEPEGCHAALCETNESGSHCLERNFGKAVSKNYSNNFK